MVTGAERRASGEFDTSKPNIARMNDYFLGGKDNFAADRRAAEQLLALAPELKTLATENRRFLGRAVRYLAEQGVRQFFDIGSGLPTRQNTHEVARAVIPGARVVYVDSDPVVISHSRAILACDELTAVVEGDILHPEEIVADCHVRRIVDFDEPMAIMLFGALHFIPHCDDPHRSVAWLRDAIPAGSYLALSHAVFDGRPQAARPIEEIYRDILESRGAHGSRTTDDVRRFFDGFELVDPGLVGVRRWRPAIQPPDRAVRGVQAVGGVARKP
jgi:S-adenosyl methyltransferase